LHAPKGTTFRFSIGDVLRLIRLKQPVAGFDIRSIEALQNAGAS
jgi:hypothetical protein